MYEFQYNHNLQPQPRKKYHNKKYPIYKNINNIKLRTYLQDSIYKTNYGCFFGGFYPSLEYKYKILKLTEKQIKFFAIESIELKCIRIIISKKQHYKNIVPLELEHLIDLYYKIIIFEEELAYINNIGYSSRKKELNNGCYIVDYRNYPFILTDIQKKQDKLLKLSQR